MACPYTDNKCTILPKLREEYLHNSSIHKTDEGNIRTIDTQIVNICSTSEYYNCEEFKKLHTDLSSKLPDSIS